MADADLANVLRKLITHDDVFLALDRHDRRNGRPVRLTVDDTTVELTEGEEVAVLAVVGW